MTFDKKYWQERYLSDQLGWDIGEVSMPLKEYFDQLTDRSMRILIPGAGNAYEAEYLMELGFNHVYVLDIADQPLREFKSRHPNFPDSQLIVEDFFDHSGVYDLVVEQTFFCALDPSFRKAYVRQTFNLLNPGGKLVGLVWGIPMNPHSPPFGGSREEYLELFSSTFEIKKLELCYNSIRPRAGRELFVHFEKKAI